MVLLPHTAHVSFGIGTVLKINFESSFKVDIVRNPTSVPVGNIIIFDNESNASGKEEKKACYFLFIVHAFACEVGAQRVDALRT